MANKHQTPFNRGQPIGRHDTRNREPGDKRTAAGYLKVPAGERLDEPDDIDTDDSRDIRFALGSWPPVCDD